jgi:Bifunctional DNA primase/polymerase, N-terminal
MTSNVTALRLTLIDRGYLPVPLHGKVPPLKTWQLLENVTRQQVEMWARSWPDAINTGALCRLMPTLDIDVMMPEAVEATVLHVRNKLDGRGCVPARTGKFPKTALVFRTRAPFPKITVNLIAPNGDTAQKVELLADGQQVVVDGVHPETGKAYTWQGGNPLEIRHDDLVCITAEEAQQLVDDVVDTVLVGQFGYARIKSRPGKRKGNGAGAKAAGGAADWQHLTDAIRNGQALHDSLCALAAKMVASGMNSGAAVNALRALMDGATCPHDERWRERRDEIPRLVDSAEAKFRQPQEPAQPAAAAPGTVADTLKVFERWLLLKDATPVLAVLGAVAANYLPGDPVWLALIAPPSSAKTEILNSTSALPHVVQAASLTPAGLLSGTSKKQQAKGAKGGLLAQIGDFGILVLKDFGTILSMHTETRAETLAALREVFDGQFIRHVGSDGGRTLSWRGKVGLVCASTGMIDSHYAVIGAMGDRFLFSRLVPTPGQAQFKRALDHTGDTTKLMRQDLAQAVAQLFAGRRSEARPISKDEAERIGTAISLVVRLRGAIERDRRTREIEAVYGAEGTARVGLALERLLAGLDTLGVERERAMEVVLSVALNSTPPLRRQAYDCVCKYRDVETADVAIALGLPTNTTRRVLEDLSAYGLVLRRSQGQGKSDLWNRAPWEAEQ